MVTPTPNSRHDSSCRIKSEVLAITVTAEMSVFTQVEHSIDSAVMF